ncbi:MAG: AMIN domain-containing protein [Candidatus Rokubacteria bacterium]|nr:AMIN domain-containing protein [Candidatus Rokubacteria bacterium]
MPFHLRTRASRVASGLLLSVLLFTMPSPGTPAGRSRLEEISLGAEGDTITVELRAAGPPRYRAEMLESPARLVVDLEDTTYAWRGSPLVVGEEPLRQIRGSQYRRDVARVVVELTGRTGYAIHETSDGLVIAIPSATAREAAPAALPPRQEGVGRAPQEPPAAERERAEAASREAPEPRVASVPPEPAPPAAPPALADAAATPAPVTATSPAPMPAAPASPTSASPTPASAVPAPPVAPVPSPAAAPASARAPVTPPVPTAEPVASPPPASAPAPKATAQLSAPPIAVPPPAGPTATPPLPSAVPAAQAAPPAPLKSTPPSFVPMPAPTPQAASGRAGEQRLISLEFKDADVVNLFRILAAESGRNIVVGDDVKGKVSISLRNVTWEQALDIIMEARNLQKLERDNIIRIVSDEQLTKERQQRALAEEAKVKAEAEVRTRIAEAALKEVEVQQKRLAAEASSREAEARGPLREETLRLFYAHPVEVAKTLHGILGISEQGTMLTGNTTLGGGPLIAEPPFAQLYGQQATQPAPQPPPVSVSQDVLAKGLTIRAHKPTNTLFLRLYSADLDRVKKLISESLDVPLPQVKIEARMEILDRNALEQIGIQWGGMTLGNIGSTSLVSQGLQTAVVSGQNVPVIPGRLIGAAPLLDPVSTIGFVPSNPNLLLQSISDAKVGGLPVSFLTGLPLGGNLINLPITSLPNSGPLPAAGIAFGIVGTRLNINLMLQALAEQGKTRTLARPEIVTVENATAKVSLGEEIPYATISSAGTQIQFKEALLQLTVTPTVIREVDATRIKMVVVVENNSRGNVVNLGSAGQPPAINKRKTETQVIVKEGERLVVGGVTTGVSQVTNRKVPLFGDIPFFGWLFKSRENFETGRELVVFLTPTVLKSDQKLGFQVPAAPPPSPPSR